MRTVIIISHLTIVFLVAFSSYSASAIKCIGPDGELLFTDQSQCPENYKAESLDQSHTRTRSSRGEALRSGFESSAQGSQTNALIKEYWKSIEEWASINEEGDPEQVQKAFERVKAAWSALKEDSIMEYQQGVNELIQVFQSGDLEDTKEAAEKVKELWLGVELLGSDPSQNSDSEKIQTDQLVKIDREGPVRCLENFKTALRSNDIKAVIESIHPMGLENNIPFLKELDGRWNEVAQNFDRARLVSVEDNKATFTVVSHATIGDVTGDFEFEVIFVKDETGIWKLLDF